MAEARGLRLPGSGGAFRSAVDAYAQVPVHPYLVRIRRWVDNQRGAVRPVNAPETPTISLALRPLPLAVTSVGRAARDYSRDSSLFCHKQTETERRSGATSAMPHDRGLRAAHLM